MVSLREHLDEGILAGRFFSKEHTQRGKLPNAKDVDRLAILAEHLPSFHQSAEPRPSKRFFLPCPNNLQTANRDRLEDKQEGGVKEAQSLCGSMSRFHFFGQQRGTRYA